VTNTQASPRLVIVDDDASVRRPLRRLLSAAGFAVETFASTHELFESNALGRSGCVVMDIHLGDATGLEAHERLTALGLSIPVVFITGDEAEATRVRADGVACLRKPFTDRELLAAIHDALGLE
jgi:FixJ family two-component response regulator